MFVPGHQCFGNATLCCDGGLEGGVTSVSTLFFACGLCFRFNALCFRFNALVGFGSAMVCEDVASRGRPRPDLLDKKD